MDWIEIKHVKAMLRASSKLHWPTMLTDITNYTHDRKVVDFCERVRWLYFHGRNSA